MLYCYSFSAVTARSFEWLTDGKSLIQTKLNRLLNSVCFRVQSIAKKEKHGDYSLKMHSEINSIWYMKVHSEEQNTWHMKIIWKIQYKFVDGKIKRFTRWYWSRFACHCTLNISYRNRRHIFCLIVLQTLISAISLRDIHERYVGEKLRGNFLWIVLIWLC